MPGGVTANGSGYDTVRQEYILNGLHLPDLQPSIGANQAGQGGGKASHKFLIFFLFIFDLSCGAISTPARDLWNKILMRCRCSDPALESNNNGTHASPDILSSHLGRKSTLIFLAHTQATKSLFFFLFLFLAWHVTSTSAGLEWGRHMR